jgi:hypothetical protein
MPPRIPGCFAAHWLLNCLYKSVKLGVNPINKDPKTMKYSVVANPEIEVNIVGRTSIKKSLQLTAPTPNIDIVQRSGIAKGMMTARTTSCDRQHIRQNNVCQ